MAIDRTKVHVMSDGRQEVLDAIGDGKLTAREIAEKLGIAITAATNRLQYILAMKPCPIGREGLGIPSDPSRFYRVSQAQLEAEPTVMEEGAEATVTNETPEAITAPRTRRAFTVARAKTERPWYKKDGSILRPTALQLQCLEAIDAGAEDVRAVVDATGLPLGVVSACVSNMRDSGKLNHTGKAGSYCYSICKPPAEKNEAEVETAPTLDEPIAPTAQPTDPAAAIERQMAQVDWDIAFAGMPPITLDLTPMIKGFAQRMARAIAIQATTAMAQNLKPELEAAMLAMPLPDITPTIRRPRLAIIGLQPHMEATIRKEYEDRCDIKFVNADQRSGSVLDGLGERLTLFMTGHNSHAMKSALEKRNVKCEWVGGGLTQLRDRLNKLYQQTMT